MADVAKLMYSAQPATSDALLYTAPATGAVVRSIHVCNTTASPATITLGHSSGATLAAANHFFSAYTIPANGTLDWSGFQVLGNAGTIRGFNGTSVACTVNISGVEL